MVIDEDLGRSAANAAERPGFARLVAEITMGHVGLVLGLEMSRLARAGRDWHQLVGLCSLAGALLADADGVYDPNWYNDRLLLGLKGTLTEGRAAFDQAADGVGPAGQGRPRRAGGAAAGRVCPPACRRGCPGPRRAGAGGHPAGVRLVRAAGHGACGAAVSGGAPRPDRDAGAVWARQRRGRLAGPAPAGPGQHAAQP